MEHAASEIARCLAREAEAVCRHYLSNGRRQGRYWIVGDVGNTPGRSLYVRLEGPASGPGAAGKWTDAATGAHGDLLDLIAANQRLGSFGATLDEACRFLSVPRPGLPPRCSPRAPIGSTEAACRLWATGRPVAGTLAERYLVRRGLRRLGLGALGQIAALRFHPRCYYGRDDDTGGSRIHAWPALLAKVTDVHGNLTGLQRTYLDTAAAGKAPVACPRKAMGTLLGHGVRIGAASDLLAAGEGLETMLSLRMALPGLPVVAALSANHCAALILPDGVRRLYIAVDRDDAGRHAAARLAERAEAKGVEAVKLASTGSDLNADLASLGLDTLRAHLRSQIAPAHAERLMHVPMV